MKNLFLGLVATVMFSFIGYTQEKENQELNKYGIGCEKFNVGINILIAWISTDIYVCCGGGFSGSWGPCMRVSEEVYNIFNKNESFQNTPQSLNLKDLFKDVDVSKINSLEITKSSIWITENNKKLMIKTGNYPVDKDGFFELEIVEIK